MQKKNNVRRVQGKLTFNKPRLQGYVQNVRVGVNTIEFAEQGIDPQ